MSKQQWALVIDDEPTIREAMIDVLELCDVQVITATSGPEGIELFRQRRAEIAFVIVDMEMPQMSGIEVIDRLCQLDPDILILLTSGYAAEDISTQIGSYKPAAFLQKPYDVGLLIDVVQEFRSNLMQKRS